MARAKRIPKSAPVRAAASRRRAQRPRQYARASLFYVAGYLLFGGGGLMAAPEGALLALGSTGEYGTVLPRAMGLMMIGLGLVVVQVIRLGVTALYPTTVAVRCVLLAGLAWLYHLSRDPFFLVVLATVGLGVVLTGTALAADRFAARR
jgi:hypothetical protein